MRNSNHCKVLIVETDNTKRFFIKINKRNNRLSTGWHLSSARLFNSFSEEKPDEIITTIKKKGYKCYFKNIALV